MKYIYDHAEYHHNLILSAFDLDKESVRSIKWFKRDYKEWHTSRDMKELERPNEDECSASDYIGYLDKYIDQLEKERDECRDSVTKLLDVNEKLLKELQTLKDAVSEHINAGGFKQLQGESI